MNGFEAVVQQALPRFVADQKMPLGKLLHGERGNPVADDQRNLLQSCSAQGAREVQDPRGTAAQQTLPRESREDAKLLAHRIERPILRGADVKDLVVNAVGDGSVAEQAIVQMTILAH